MWPGWGSWWVRWCRCVRWGWSMSCGGAGFGVVSSRGLAWFCGRGVRRDYVGLRTTELDATPRQTRPKSKRKLAVSCGGVAGWEDGLNVSAALIFQGRPVLRLPAREGGSALRPVIDTAIMTVS